MRDWSSSAARAHDYDVCVVGLGGHGSAIAAHLAQRGAKVIGLDKFGPVHDQVMVSSLSVINLLAPKLIRMRLRSTKQRTATKQYNAKILVYPLLRTWVESSEVGIGSSHSLLKTKTAATKV
jgi:glycine/D-amino acid oxidase-like deaminating enzyme